MAHSTWLWLEVTGFGYLSSRLCIIQCSKLVKCLEFAVMSMALCIIKNT